MNPYYEERVRRLWIAYQYEGWETPPFPGRHIGRVVMTGPYAGFYPDGSPMKARLDVSAKAKELAQNRKHFPRGG